jgi:p-aminobenzoyl-glutamate transporter AbgT
VFITDLITNQEGEMEIFYAVCVGITALAVVIITFYLVTTLKQMRKTTLEVEKLAKNANDHLETTKDLIKTFTTISESMGSVWLKGLKYMIAAVTGLKLFKKHLTSEKEF